MKNDMPNPVRGDIWAHMDGGSVYVLYSKGAEYGDVCVQRRPFGDSQAINSWIAKPKFFRLVTHRIRRVRL